MAVSISAMPTSSYISLLRSSSTSEAARRERTTTTDNSNEAESTTVSLSSAARQAAKSDSDAGLKLPDAEYWMRKDFPEDIMAEAKARLAERQAAPGIGDGYLPSSVSNLPLLPENQALLDQFRQEMKAIGHNNSDPAANARFNRLLNLSLRVQIEGWKAPMTEADAQRELDIQQAMAVLDTDTAKPAVATSNEALTDPLSGWKQRWQQEGLSMPSVSLTPGKSLWLSLADQAGIGQDEFVTKARELATQLTGNALTRAIEQFISDRYVASTEASPAA